MLYLNGYNEKVGVVNMAFGRPKKLKARWDKFYSKQEMNFKVPDISL